MIIRNFVNNKFCLKYPPLSSHLGKRRSGWWFRCVCRIHSQRFGSAAANGLHICAVAAYRAQTLYHVCPAFVVFKNSIKQRDYLCCFGVGLLQKLKL